MTKPAIRIAAVVFAAIAVVPALIVGFWATLHSDPYDPKNLRYVLWRDYGTALDLDRAVYTFAVDFRHRDMVLGMTKAQLRDRFGFLTPVSKARADLQYCVESTPWLKGSDVLYLRNSDVLVVFDQGRVREILITKGC